MSIATSFAGGADAFARFAASLDRRADAPAGERAGSAGVADLSLEFARFVARLAGPAATVELLVAAALASQQVADGNTCADLRALLANPAAGAEDELHALLPAGLDLAGWTAALRHFPGIVGAPPAGDDPVRTPLVLDGAGRLYLGRYFAYEREVARGLRALAERETPVDEGALREALDEFFPPPAAPADAGEPPDEQRVAGAIAATRALCVVSGGPGTGKTWTVVRILAALARLRARAGGEPLAIGLAAPTGKAAARVQEAVEAARAGLPEDVRERIPAEAATIHRLLGARSDSIYFRHDAGRPLALDVLVVDEASMVDLPLMAKLLRALPDDARLVLVGDKDQLASVEAGSVLGDICARNPGPGPRSCERIARLCGRAPAAPVGAPAGPVGDGPLRESIAVLTRNRRFGADTGIHRLAQAVRSGAAEEALALLRAGHGDIRRVETRPGQPLEAALGRAAVDGYRRYLDIARGGGGDELFKAFGAFRVLCAVRRGPFGVERVNEAIASALDDAGLVSHREGWYVGRPVMVTRNDHALRLFNGAVGIVIGEGTVCFESESAVGTALAPARLPAHETVYAMTIHKSQGSEFDSVVVVLPSAASPLVGRELLYTAITRARVKVEIWASEAEIRRVIDASLARASGLADALWSPGI